MQMEKVDYQTREFRDAKEWEEWLSSNWNTIPGVWLKFAKKASGIVTVNYDEALDVALCYGWIDSQTKSLDEKYYLQKFTPRVRRSVWSKINVENVLRLTKEGRMRKGGIAEVEKAKADGRWDNAYDSPKNMRVPDDFIRELKKDSVAFEFFQSLNRTDKFKIARMLVTAVKPETRVRRMKKLLEMMRKGEKLY